METKATAISTHDMELCCIMMLARSLVRYRKRLISKRPVAGRADLLPAHN